MVSTRGKRNVVYLLHFGKPLHHAQHYLGSAARLSFRVGQHRKGKGARLTAAVASQGIDIGVVRVWQCDTLRDAKLLEAKMKRQRNGRRYCPVCVRTPKLARNDQLVKAYRMASRG